jgi:large subunit ribosomal protein L9
MKVILLKQQRGLGKIGDVVTVKDGYGRNYLVPQKIAIRATEANQNLFKEQKATLEQNNLSLREKAVNASKKISGKDFVFIRQSGDDGRLFGSVSAKDIANLITSSTNIAVTYDHVFISAPIKALGIYEVELSLHPEVQLSILVNVARSDSEAKDALASHNSKNNISTSVEA